MVMLPQQPIQALEGEGAQPDGDGWGGSHLKEGDGLEHSCGARCLPDGVHGQLRTAQIQYAQPQPRSQDRSNGSPTGRVIPDHEILGRGEKVFE